LEHGSVEIFSENCNTNSAQTRLAKFAPDAIENCAGYLALEDTARLQLTDFNTNTLAAERLAFVAGPADTFRLGPTPGHALTVWQL